MADLTAKEALDLIAETAQHCRENGESDMRTILNVVRGIKQRIDDGQTGEEIIDAYAKEAVQVLIEQAKEIERLHDELAALRKALAGISEEMGLPETMGPAKGELKRLLDNGKSAAIVLVQQAKEIERLREQLERFTGISD